MESQEIWQVEVNGEIYEAQLEELTEWIAEGTLLPQDKVRRGNLRWIQAVKVPALYGFFNAKELGVTLATPVSVNSAAPESNETPATVNAPANFPQEPNLSANQTFAQPAPFADVSIPKPVAASNPANFSFADLAEQPSSVCLMHPNIAPVYVCDGCANAYCKTCPKSFGGTAKICPMCGAMCKPVSVVRQEREKSLQSETKPTESKGIFSSLKNMFGKRKT